MKLYYSPGACSLSPHIVAKEAGIELELVQVDLAKKQTKAGADFNAVNPKGYVPTLLLDDGAVLTEGPAIVQYLADRKPASGLAPAAGSMDRYRLQEWLNFITSELHKGFSPLFRPTTPDAYKEIVRENLAKRFDHLDMHFAKNDYLMGKQFTVADAYCFTVLNWSNFVKLSMDKWTNVKAYMARVAARPNVLAAMKAEGLLQ